MLLRWLGRDVEAERQCLVGHIAETFRVPFEVLRIALVLRPWIVRLEGVSQSGDWKRKEIYAKGMKLFPHTRKHIIAHALEVAISRLRLEQ